MKKVYNFVKGKKTLVSSLVGFLYMLGVWNGYFEYSDDVVKAIQLGVSVGLADKLVRALKK